MKKIGLLIFAAAALIGVVFANFLSFGKIQSPGIFKVSWGSGVRGSGNVVTENRNITGFRKVEVGGVFTVEVVAGKEFSVQVEADDNLVPLIKTEVEDGVLEISAEKRIRSSSKLIVRVTAPEIEHVDVGGAAKASVSGIKNNDFSAHTSGASKLSVSGETANAKIEVSGASKIDAAGLKTGNAEIDASGASKVTIDVSGDLKADASGASKINYTGTPRNIEKHTSGASKVSQE